MEFAQEMNRLGISGYSEQVVYVNKFDVILIIISKNN